jgi:hypothetical protein
MMAGSSMGESDQMQSTSGCILGSTASTTHSPWSAC